MNKTKESLNETEQRIGELEEENKKLKKKNKNLQEENDEFKKIFSSVMDITSEKAKKGILKKIKEALKKLAFYESPNMPSSAPKLNDLSSSDTIKKKRKKRGGQKGHRGSTRKKPDQIDGIKQILLTNCPHCSTELGKPFGFRDRLVEDIVFENLVEVIRYIIYLYYCPVCKKVVSGIPLDVLPKMNFGTNVTVLTAFLKYKYRLTFKLIKNFFEDFFRFPVSEGALAYQIKKISQILQKSYEEIEKEIKKSESRSIDETGEKWLGGKAWGWKYITRLASLYKLSRTRSHKELYETLGENCGGGTGCDGHTAYNMLRNSKIQRCWEHIWRPARYKIKEGEASKELEVFYKKLVHIIKLSDEHKKKNFPFKNMKKVKERYYRMLGNHIEKFYKDSTVKKIIASIHNYWEKDELFTFLEYKELNYHNNDTERDIREEVIQRKISGGVRSDDGARYRSILRSIIRTYEKTEVDFMDEVKKQIVLSNLAE